MDTKTEDITAGIIVEKIDNIEKVPETVVSNFLLFFLAAVGIRKEGQNKILQAVWFKLLVFCFVTSVTCQLLLCFHINDLSKIVQALIFIFHSIFLNFATFFIYLRQEHIVEMVNLKENYFSGFYEQSLVMRNYMTSDDGFKKFLVKFGTTACMVHFLGTIVSPLLNFFLTDAEMGSDVTLILPSWYPWTMDTVLAYAATYVMQFFQVFTLMIPILGNFLFVVYFVIEIRIQKSNLCNSLNNIVVYAYWESMSNESPIFQMLSSNAGQHKSYDDLLYEYLGDCIKHHILINLFINKFIKCYNLVFIGCLAYSVGNLSLICYSLVLIAKSGDIGITSFIAPIEGLLTVLVFILLYCYLGEVITSINNSVRYQLYDIKWYEQSQKYQKAMLTFMCLTQRDIVLKGGVTHIASYALFASVVKLSYQFFNILLTSAS